MATTRRRLKRQRRSLASLAEMTADQFMEGGLNSSEDEGEEEEVVPAKKKKKSAVGGHKVQLHRLAKTDPEFYQFLQDHDQGLLQFSGSDEEEEEGEEKEEEEEEEEEDNEEEEEEEEEDEEKEEEEEREEEDRADEREEEREDGMGELEPVPHHITSRREKIEHPPSDEEEEEEEVEDSRRPRGQLVTRSMVHKWVKRVTKSHSLSAFHQLTLALHAAVTEILDKPRDGGREREEEGEDLVYYVEGGTEFNMLVVACLKHALTCISHHIPLPPQHPGRRFPLPSSHPAWRQVRTIVKPYLSDLLRLLTSLSDSSMQCAVLRHMHSLSAHFACFPRLQQALTRSLIQLWATGEHHVQVLAFLILRRVTLHHPHPSLHHTLKKLYLAFVRNCKFTSASSLPRIRFMRNCLVELLTIDPPTTYQHAFVYLRQLALHLRTAMTTGRKEGQQSVYNWQFVHCLDLWAQVLGEVSHPSLRPLIYPLVQTTLGTLQLQPTPRYYPLRLHCVRTLLQLAQSTDTYIPLAPFLLEVLESQAVGVSSLPQSGKPPDLASLLRAGKQLLQSRGLQSALLNECFELLLQFFAGHAHCIGFPELAFPALVRLRKVAKTTPLSWLRMQLKQLIEKAEEVSREVTRERSKVNFSPKDYEQITLWEKERRGKENTLSRFLFTWCKINREVEGGERGGRGEGGRGPELTRSRSRKTSKSVQLPQTVEREEEEEEEEAEEEEEEEMEEGEEDGKEDIVEDFCFSSDSDLDSS